LALFSSYFWNNRKTIFKRNLGIFIQDEESQRQGLRRNVITVKIMARQLDEVLDKNNKLQQK